MVEKWPTAPRGYGRSKCVSQYTIPFPLADSLVDRLFYQALTLFQHVRIYANAVNDVTVPYPTAAIEQDDHFINHEKNGIQVCVLWRVGFPARALTPISREFDEEYSPIMKSYTYPTSVVQPPKPRLLSAQWFKQKKPSRPLLPPALQFGFPYNVVRISLSRHLRPRTHPEDPSSSMSLPPSSFR